MGSGINIVALLLPEFSSGGRQHIWQNSKLLLEVILKILVKYEVFTAVTMKNGVFWDVMQCGSCKNRRNLARPSSG
jgi:hypothetical protein